MPFNSTAFLADRELQALDPPVTGYKIPHETSMSAKNKWLAGLDEADRDKLREEWEYEQSKNNYRYD